MNCGFDHELVNMYADGELRRERLPSIRTHIAACEECSAILREIRQVGNALSSVQPEQAPVDLVDRIVRNAEPKSRRSVWNAARWTAGAVLTVAMRGFTVDEELAAAFRRESPSWVARWVLFV